MFDLITLGKTQRAYIQLEQTLNELELLNQH